MNCNKLQNDLALAAVGSLEPSRLAVISAHCRGCAACAERLRQFQLIAGAHAQAAEELHHARLELDTTMTPTARVRLAEPFRIPLRWLASAAAALALLLAVLWRFSTSTPPPSSAPGRPELATHSTIAPLPPPTVASYRRALRASGDAALDSLLASQEQHLLPATPGNGLRLASASVPPALGVQ